MFHVQRLPSAYEHTNCLPSMCQHMDFSNWLCTNRCSPFLADKSQRHMRPDSKPMRTLLLSAGLTLMCAMGPWEKKRKNIIHFLVMCILAPLRRKRRLLTISFEIRPNLVQSRRNVKARGWYPSLSFSFL